MDFRQLEMFIAVAENSSFTIAGQQLYVAQSAISRKVKMLEEELGELLFKRVNKRLYLTPAGETMLRHSRKIFQDLRNAALEVSELSQMKRGSIRIGAGMTACMYILPPLLEQFRNLYPHVDARVVTGTSEYLIHQIRNNILDIGILTLPVRHSDLETMAFRTEEMVVLVNATHPTLGKRKCIPACELANHPLILFSRETATRRLLDDMFASVGIEPQIAMESENVATIAPLVRINLGISIVPLPVAADPGICKGLHSIRISDFKVRRHVGLVVQRSANHPRAIREMVELFRKGR
jgi:LysR family cyn operon transcriptional activator